MLHGKKILIGITGSIAAYKSALLVRELIRSGAEVQVIMTESATQFISPLTFSTLSKNPVHTSFQKNEQGEWTNHVELGIWADLFIIAPCSANTLSKMALGICDSLLLATYLSSRNQVIISPAMDLDMYVHPAVQANMRKLEEQGVKIIEAEVGELASGLSGRGRMPEPIELFKFIQSSFTEQQALKGVKALITAGPTQEPLDPVRYISNHSSGKMGYNIAEELTRQGCEVTLVTGPTQIDVPVVHSLINVKTAEEMFEACQENYKEMDLLVLSAAVADYTPANYSSEKIKKIESQDSLPLKKTKDIAQWLGENKKSGQFTVGFALETEQEEINALSKLKKKNFDLIVLNSLKESGAGFGLDTNKITIFDKDNNRKDYELKSKREVAKDIVREIIEHR